jgi:hypothetical protein
VRRKHDESPAAQFGSTSKTRKMSAWRTWPKATDLC